MSHPISGTRNAALIPMLAVFGSVTFLGLGTSLAKHSLFPVVGANGTTALRLAFSSLLLLMLWRPWRRSPSRADICNVALYGAALGLMNMAFYQALRTLPFGIAVAIEFSGPLTVAILASRRAVDFVWVALAITGLGLLLPLGHQVSALDPVGVLYALVAAVCWAMYIIFGKRVGHLHAGHSVSLGISVGALLAIPPGILDAGASLFTLPVMATGVIVAALSSAIPISLEMVALKRLPSQAFGIMISLEPAVAAVLALMLLGERLMAMQWLAIALIVAASAGSAMTARASRRVPNQLLP